MPDRHELPLPAKLALVEALLACDCVKSPQSRDQVVADLPAGIRNKINRHPNGKQDVTSIVTTCLQFGGGLDSLLGVIKYYEEGSVAWQQVEAVLPETGNAAQGQAAAREVAPTPPARADSASAAKAGPAAAAGKRYDVFLSYNSLDRAAVERLAARLDDEAGLKPFLDKWWLVPGEASQEALERALDESATCAVCVGPNGIGPWNNLEMRWALDERVRDDTLRVIPVLLPGADPKDPKALPRFLRLATWVDFRAGIDDPEAFRLLLAGIRGEAPGRGLL